MSNFFASRRTIAQITAPITDIVSQLNTHAEYHAAKATGHEDAAAIHKDLARASKDEVHTAFATADKIAGVFSL